jgi:hypothetical protein
MRSSGEASPSHQSVTVDGPDRHVWAHSGDLTEATRGSSTWRVPSRVDQAIAARPLAPGEAKETGAASADESHCESGVGIGR